VGRRQKGRLQGENLACVVVVVVVVCFAFGWRCGFTIKETIVAHENHRPRSQILSSSRASITVRKRKTHSGADALRRRRPLATAAAPVVRRTLHSRCTFSLFSVTFLLPSRSQIAPWRKEESNHFLPAMPLTFRLVWFGFVPSFLLPSFMVQAPESSA
jgi:hypothetical protein